MDQDLTAPEQETLEAGTPTVRQAGARLDPNACTVVVQGADTLVSSLAPFDPTELPEGTMLAGKYRVERVIGKGGMGLVLAAEHVELRERVALKLMLPEAMESAQAVARFLREARAAAKIKGEHVTRVLDVGKLESGAPYIVMEYLDGRDLGDLLADEGAMPVEDAVECVLQACEAIAEAHAIGIVHRDLKPSNLFLTQRPDGSPSVKVLDFGISKQLPNDKGGEEAQDVAVTRTRQVLGSPLYMSPEQLTSARSVGPPSDIWSLGAILFELVSGAPPFSATTLSDLRRQILFEPVPSLRQLRPDAPRRLDAILRRCLAKDLTKRYPDVAALARDLRELAPARARHSIERVQAILRNAGVVQAAPATTGVVRRRGVALGVALGALAIGGLGAFAASRRGSEEAAASMSGAGARPGVPDRSATAEASAAAPPAAPEVPAPPAVATPLEVAPASPPAEPEPTAAPAAAAAKGAPSSRTVTILGPSSARRPSEPAPTASATPLEVAPAPAPAPAPPAPTSSAPFSYKAWPLK